MNNTLVKIIRNQLDESSVELFYRVILAHCNSSFDDELLDTMNKNSVFVEDHHDEIYGKGTLLDIEGKTYRIYEDKVTVETHI